MLWFIPLAAAAIGAMADKKNPMRGAAIGAAAGMTGGAALGAMGGVGAAGGAAASGAGSAGGLLGAGGATAGFGGAAGTQAGMLAAQEAGLGSTALGWGGATTGVQGGLNGLLGADMGAKAGGLLSSAGQASNYIKPITTAMEATKPQQQPAPQAPQLPVHNGPDLSGILAYGQQQRQYDDMMNERRKQLMQMYASKIGGGYGPA